MTLKGCPIIAELQVPPSVSLTSVSAGTCGYVLQSLGGSLTPLRGRTLRFVVSIPYGLDHVLATYGSAPPDYELQIGALTVAVDVYGVVRLTYAGEPAHGPVMQLHAGAAFDFTIGFGSPLAVRTMTLCNAGREQWTVDFGPQQSAFEAALDDTVAVSGLSATAVDGEPVLALELLAGVSCSAPSGPPPVISATGWALNPLQKAILYAVLAILLVVVLAVLAYRHFSKSPGGGGARTERGSP